MASVPNPIGFNYSDQAFSTAWNTPSLALVAGRGVGTPTSPSGSIWAPGGSYGAQYPTFRQAGGILFAYVNVIDNVIKSGESSDPISHKFLDGLGTISAQTGWGA